MNYIYSLDIGSATDFAVGTLIMNHQRWQDGEAYRGRTERDRNRNVVRENHVIYIWRPALRTLYSEIVKKTKWVLEQPRLTQNCYLVIDQGQAGEAVRQMMVDKGMAPIGITSTAGQKVNRGHTPGITVPKRDLVNALKIELEQDRLKIANGIDHKDQLIKELQSFKGGMTKKGHDTYEAMTENIHDDMVMSLAQGIWYARDVWPRGTYVEPEKKPEDDAGYDVLNYGL